MNNCRLISLIIALLIFLALSLLPIISAKIGFQLLKGSHENSFRYHKKTRATEWWEKGKVEENRQYPRSIVNWPVTINTPQEAVSGQMRDVSPGGAFIYCDSFMTPNHIFFLSIHIHSSTLSLSCMAESVWSTHGGMGVRFDYDNPEQGHLLAKFILDAWRPENSLSLENCGVTGSVFLLDIRQYLTWTYFIWYVSFYLKIAKVNNYSKLNR